MTAKHSLNLLFPRDTRERDHNDLSHTMLPIEPLRKIYSCKSFTAVPEANPQFSESHHNKEEQMVILEGQDG